MTWKNVALMYLSMAWRAAHGLIDNV